MTGGCRKIFENKENMKTADNEQDIIGVRR